MPARSVLCWILVPLLIAPSLPGQPSKAVKVKQQAAKIGVLGKVTVYMPNGDEFYGNIRSLGADDFTINEVDLHRQITLRYDEVRRIRRGYGEGRSIYGKRIHPHTKLIVTLAVVGGLLAITFIAVASDRS